MKIVIIILSFLINFIIVNGQSGLRGVNRDRTVIVHFDPEISTIKLLNTIPATIREKADRYTEGGHWLILWNFVNAVLIAWIFLFQGLSGYVRSLSTRIAGRVLGNFVYISLYFVLSYLFSMPLNIYQNFVREKQYGVFNQSFVQWMLKDLLKFTIEFMILVPVFLLGYTYLHKTKGSLRVLGRTISIAFVAGVMFLNPVFSSTVATNETVFYTPGILLKTNLEYGLLILLCFLFFSWTLNEFIVKYGKRMKLSNIKDITSLPLLVFLITCYLFIATPLSNTIKRNLESEADFYGLQITRKPDAFSSFILKSADHDKINPGYWEEILFFDHPSIKKRIFGAMKWKAGNIIFLPLFDIKGFRC